MEVEAGDSKLLIFQNFWFTFFFLPERVVEELALLKIRPNNSVETEFYGWDSASVEPKPNFQKWTSASF